MSVRWLFVRVTVSDRLPASDEAILVPSERKRVTAPTRYAGVRAYRATGWKLMILRHR